MSDPRPEVLRFVSKHRPGARLSPIAGDASQRRFHRVHPRAGDTCVVMDYGRPFSGTTDDETMSRIFLEAGLPVAAVLEGSEADGCLLLEDLGPTTLEQALLEGSRDPAPVLLERAAHLAARVVEDGTPVLARSTRAAGPALDADRFRFEMHHFLEHFVRGLLGRSPSPELVARVEHLADAAAPAPRLVLCHRDFHSRNLMVRDGGELAMVDIQDARWGPDTYDLASLLFDAYIEIEPPRRRALSAAYRSRLAAPPDADFDRRLDVVAAQRMIKALGTFGYQLHVKGDARYEAAIPRTASRLRELLPSRDETRHLGALLVAEGIL